MLSLERFASLVASVAILFTITVNVYYLIRYKYIIQFVSFERYSTDRQYKYGEANINVLDEELVYRFFKDDANTTEVMNSLRSKGTSIFDTSAKCFTKGGEDRVGSIYAACGQLDKARLPGWAQEFESLMFQDFALATPQEFRLGFAPSYVGVQQGYKNNREGWMEYSAMNRMYCSKEILAHKLSTGEPKSIYTRQHGKITSVDCTKEGVSSMACDLVVGGSNYTLIDDAFILQHEVFVTNGGSELILMAWGQENTIGVMAEQSIYWMHDCCLSISGNEMAWHGLGYSEFKVSVPQSALISKIQLLGLTGMAWYVDGQLSPLKFLRSLVKTSRLGIFFVIVAQMMYAFYLEIDILRTIYSWEIDEPGKALLYGYILVTIGLAIALLSIGVLRIYGGHSICRAGNIAAVFNTFGSIIVAITIAEIHYTTYTLENGMQYMSHPDCPVGFLGCTDSSKFNYILLTGFSSILPTAFDWLYYKMLMKKHFSNSSLVVNQEERCDKLPPAEPKVACWSKPAKNINSFEMHCLFNLKCEVVVRDVLHPSILKYEKRYTNYRVYEACGFTLIRGHFLIRTKELYMLFLARLIPYYYQTAMLTVWEVSMKEDEEIVVLAPVRCYVKYLDSLGYNANDGCILKGDNSSIS